MDLRDHRLKYRWARRHLDDGDARAGLLGQRREHLANGHGNLMTAAVAIAFIKQLHVKFSAPRLASHVVVADHAIEVERRSRPCVGLDGRHLGHCLHYLCHARGQILCRREGRSLRHVHHHAELGLIVQRQHFHRYRLGVKQRTGEEERHHDESQGGIPHHLVADDGQQQSAEKPLQTFVGVMLPLFRLLEVSHAGPNSHGQPRREDECGKQREDHRHRTEGGNRLHVGAHHTAHKSHGEERRNDCQRGENGWVAHLAHRIHGGFGAHLPLVKPATVDVFDDHDRIIHQDTDGEDEGEQTDAVNGITEHPSRENGDEDHHGDDEQHHQRRTQA